MIVRPPLESVNELGGKDSVKKKNSTATQFVDDFGVCCKWDYP